MPKRKASSKSSPQGPPRRQPGTKLRGGQKGSSGLPAIIEQEKGGDFDNIIPTRGYQMMPMVGLGGSAGSVGALQTFFKKMPPTSGMVFVVVLHLSAEHESSMAELLQRCTTMRVIQVRETQKVQANSVYVIPPGKQLAAIDGYLRLASLQHERGKRVTIDLFFRTLADTHGPHSAAIILSGADRDGTLGIKRIKERGGLTIAQDPGEAEHAGMPRSAIDTGMVDWILPVDQMPQRLVAYAENESRQQLPPEDGPHPAQATPRDTDKNEECLREILRFLQSQTGRDFSYYKRATIVRRISRRMQVNELVSLSAYLAFVRTHPGEVGALLQDLLISVTNFFRDRESFDVLKAQIPDLFKNKGPTDVVRVWVAGCATGEEAYSIAILLSEHARKLPAPPGLQIFATDLDEDAIARAREGFYPETIAADVSSYRLQSFFMKRHDGFAVRRDIREIVLFAVHDLLKDSPFSHLHLISCRNLLIYLNSEAQARALDIFHFALRPSGRLFLGASESVLEGSPLFAPLDKKHRVYARQANGRTAVPALPGQLETIARVLAARKRAESGSVVPGPGFSKTAAAAETSRPEIGIDRSIPWSAAHLKMIEQLAPPSVLINREYEIMHLSENAGRFLQISGGEPSMNLLRVVHPMLRVELRTTLFRALRSQEPVEILGVPMDDRGEHKFVDIQVVPGEFESDFLVVFKVRPEPEGPPSEAHPLMREPLVGHLEGEIEKMKGEMREMMEQYETNTQELKAGNEELQAMNEELRSATEELETSREELQSINEELATLNTELKGKVDELGRANSVLHNLMGATAIPTVFLDRSLKIVRFTQSAVEIFHLIEGDLGRPLSDLKHPLHYPALISDAQRVVTEMLPVEREVESNDGRFFVARLLPYHTAEERIAGVVLTLLDITEQLQAQRSLREANDLLEHRVAERTKSLRELNETLEALIRASPLAIARSCAQGLIQLWNPAAEQMFGWRAEEVIGHPLPNLPHNNREFYEREWEDFLEKGAPSTGLETRRQKRSGTVIDVTIWAADVKAGPDVAAATLMVTADMSGRKNLERALLEASEREQRRIGQDLHDGLCQALFGISMKAKALAADLRTTSQSNASEFDKLAQLLGRAIQQTRGLVHGLVPVALESGGIGRVLKDLGASVSWKIPCQVHCAPRLKIENRESALHLFRIAQEAIHNAVRHSQARRITVSLEATDRAYILDVCDDGIGFDFGQVTAESGVSFGLASMKYRATALGATLSVFTPRRGGTTVRCMLPRRAKPHFVRAKSK